MAYFITSVTRLRLERQFSGVLFLLPQRQQLSLTRVAFTCFVHTWWTIPPSALSGDVDGSIWAHNLMAACSAMAILTTTLNSNVVSRMSRLWILRIESPTTNCTHNAYSRNWPNVHVAVIRFKLTSTSGVRSSVFRNLFPKIYLSSIINSSGVKFVLSLSIISPFSTSDTSWGRHQFSSVSYVFAPHATR